MAAKRRHPLFPGGGALPYMGYIGRCMPRNKVWFLRFSVLKWGIFFPVFLVWSLHRVAKLYLRNRKHVPCIYRVIQTRAEVWENEKCCGNTSRRRVFPQFFRVLPNFHKCLYNSIETRSTCFLFLLENTATRKMKTTC